MKVLSLSNVELRETPSGDVEVVVKERPLVVRDGCHDKTKLKEVASFTIQKEEWKKIIETFVPPRLYFRRYSDS